MRVTIDIERPAWMRLGGRRKFSLAGVILVLVVLLPTVVLAGDRFTDVPSDPGDPTGQFHDQINAIAGAGITKGCNPAGTLFCPEDPVDRRSMAAFMTRGFSRVGNASDIYSVTALPSVPASGQTSFDPVDVGSVTIDVPGATGETQFVMITGKLGVYTNSTFATYCTGATCTWRIEIYDGTTILDDAIFRPTGDNDAATMSLNAVVPEGSGTTQTYTMRIWYEGTIATGTFTPYDFSLSAITVPFGATGGSTLSSVSSNAEAESDATTD